MGIYMGSPAAALPFGMIILGIWLVQRSIAELRRRRAVWAV
jgi:TRAP-type C4-dicarboxylate transport system permease small subunit